MSNSEANKCNYPACGCSPEPDAVGSFKVFCPYGPEYEWGNTTNIGITPQEKITHTGNKTQTLMNEIKEIKSELEEILDFADRRFNIVAFTGLSTPSKDKLMRLIELIEEAQVENCNTNFYHDHYENVISEDSIRNAPRVSQQLTEKE